MSDAPADRLAFGEIARRTVLITAIALVFVCLLLLLWSASEAVLTLLVSILVAVIFDAGARGLGYLMSCRRTLRLVIVFVLAFVLIGAACWFGGNILIEQMGQFATAMKQLLSRLNDTLSNGVFGLPKGTLDLKRLLPNGGMLFGGATEAVTTVFTAVTTAFVVLFTAAFLAWEPQTYKAVVLSLFPKAKRPRLDAVLDEAAEAMREWLLGQSISMACIFLFSLAALLLIGMPYPAVLALQAGLLTFIPTVGPFIAGVVIVLAGLSQNFTMALYGLGVYVMIQFLETHLITPMVQERTVRIPPAIALGIQLIAAALFGLLGIAFAVPIAAAAKVLIEELYVKDQLGGPWEPH